MVSAFTNSLTSSAFRRAAGAVVDFPAPFGPAMTTTLGMTTGASQATTAISSQQKETRYPDARQINSSVPMVKKDQTSAWKYSSSLDVFELVAPHGIIARPVAPTCCRLQHPSSDC